MKTAPNVLRNASLMGAADRRAAAKNFRVVHLPTPALREAMDAEKRGEFEHVEDVDAWFRKFGLRK